MKYRYYRKGVPRDYGTGPPKVPELPRGQTRFTLKSYGRVIPVKADEVLKYNRARPKNKGPRKRPKKKRVTIKKQIYIIEDWNKGRRP